MQALRFMLIDSIVPRPSLAPFSWPHTWPLNRPEKRGKAALSIFYVIKPQGTRLWRTWT